MSAIKHNIYKACVAIGIMLVTACSKNKEDARAGNLPDYTNLAKSTTRIINLNNAIDLVVNSTRLTNFVGVASGLPPDPSPTRYFPTNGKFAGAYYLPQQFFDKNNEATVKLYGTQVAPAPNYLIDSFKVQDNYAQPWDYYTGTSNTLGATGNYTFTRVPRSPTVPSNPANIRIRMVNLSQSSYANGTSKLSLAYADGSAVNNVTSAIAGNTWSDYVEIPYGTYQFKVLVDGKNIQLAGKPPMLTAVSSATALSYGNTQVYYSPVQTFQPGGVYTVVVASLSGYEYNFASLPANLFTIVTDVEPNANVTYGRIQGINAANNNGIKFQVDNGTPAQAAYGTATDYTTLINGTHTVTISDASGNKLASQTVSINSGDNLSVWAYPNSTGSTTLTVVQNNMTGIRSTTTNADGSDPALGIYNPLLFGMLLQTRFLNLCPDLPYVTFTNNNGALFTDGRYSTALAAQNLKPGQVADPAAASYPYVDLGFLTGGAVQAYQSAPNVVPGNRLTGVPPLSTADFVRMPSFFFNSGNFGSEPGVYTVALIGRSTSTAQPNMIVIKHNR